MLKNRRSEQGSAMLIVIVILLILIGISGAYMTMSWANRRRATLDQAATQALYIAEAGAAAYVSGLNTGNLPVAQPIQYLAGGYYWVPAENIVDFSNAAMVGATNAAANSSGPSYVAFQIAAKYGGVTRRLDVIANHQPGGPLNAGLWAGNNGDPSRGHAKDPNYTLSLQQNFGIDPATGKQVTTTDTIQGDVYSGGNFSTTNTPSLSGIGGQGADSVTVAGANSSTLSGPNMKSGTEPALQIDKNYSPTTAGVPPQQGVGGTMTQAQAMAQAYPPGTRDANGVAWIDVGAQMSGPDAVTNHKWAPDGSYSYATDITNVQNPAHIFRKNPTSNGSMTNRTSSYEHVIDTTSIGPAGNKRADYYIEDPTSSSVTQASLTGVPVNGDTSASMVNIQPNGNNAVYYVPGNLRVSGENIKSYQLDPAPGVNGPIQMTMVVQGNVSLTDNILYPHWESTTDQLAIVAVTDPNYPNSLPTDFAAGSGTTPITPYGVSVNQFVSDFNNRATTARSEGLNIPNLDLSTAAGQYRASVEYNKVYGSGNVYFGDPGSGTVEHFEGFLYAENNFYATDLDTTQGNGGTKQLEIWGNMTAGNQVDIDRSSIFSPTGQIPFRVLFDPSILGKRPPGIPLPPQSASSPWVISSWRQSANTAETKQQ